MNLLTGYPRSATAVAFLIVPLFASAQNIVNHPGIVNRDVERFTLLTGPGLLSPPHGVPAAALGVTFVSGAVRAAEARSFQDLPAPLSRPARQSFSPEGAYQPRFPREDMRPASPESLQLKNTLPSTPVKLPSAFPPAPKRD